MRPSGSVVMTASPMLASVTRCSSLCSAKTSAARCRWMAFRWLPGIGKGARQMELSFGIAGGQGGCLAEHAHRVGGAVEGEIRLPQAIQADGIVGAQCGGRFQVGQSGLGFAYLVVQAAARRVRDR